MVLRM